MTLWVMRHSCASNVARLFLNRRLADPARQRGRSYKAPIPREESPKSEQRCWWDLHGDDHGGVNQEQAGDAHDAWVDGKRSRQRLNAHVEVHSFMRMLKRLRACAHHDTLQCAHVLRPRRCAAFAVKWTLWVGGWGGRWWAGRGWHDSNDRISWVRANMGAEG
jgi:hypothetical protein